MFIVMAKFLVASVFQRLLITDSGSATHLLATGSTKLRNSGVQGIRNCGKPVGLKYAVVF